jgi:ribosomal protein S18 acetylase RimI-like enzyme
MWGSRRRATKVNTGMVRVRLARSDDVPELRQLCRAAVGPDDYVPDFLPEMVRRGEAMVVEASGRLVTMGGVAACVDGALWIGQLRTHPDFRRRGYATMLLAAAYERAARERRPALRLYTGRRNPSRSLYERIGFREVARFTRLAAPPLRRGAPALARAEDGGGAFHLWRWSPYAAAGAGYAGYRWHIVPITRRLLDALAGRGEVLVGDGSALLAWVEPGSRAAIAAVLGEGRAGLRAARAAAARLRRARIEVVVPRDQRILRWARESGFGPASWGRHLVLYEQRVRRRR